MRDRLTSFWYQSTATRNWRQKLASGTWKSRLAVVDFDLRHLIAKPSTRTSVRCKDLGDICCTSRGIVHFVLNFVAMAKRVGRSEI